MESKLISVVTNLKHPLLVEYTPEDLKEGEVRIKVISCPINPSDMFMTEGSYGIWEMYRSQEQMGVGFEGAGEIIETGPKVPKEVVGRKIAFSQDPHSPTFTGTWRQ